MINPEQLKAIMDEVEALDLPDGAHWAMVHEVAGLEYGDAFDIIGNNPELFGVVENE